MYNDSSSAGKVSLLFGLAQVNQILFGDKQGYYVTGVLSRASAALHFVAPSDERFLVAATIGHGAVFEESRKVIQVHPRKQLEILE